MFHRLKKGWSVEKALTTDVKIGKVRNRDKDSGRFTPVRRSNA